MSTQYVAIKAFSGIDQAGDPNTRTRDTSPDARNMDTKDGNLTVAAGFVKHIATKVPCDGPVRREFIFKGLTSNTFVVIAKNAGAMNVFACDPVSKAWRSIYQYPASVVGLKWDAVQCNIGNDDYLIIGCGEHQLIKWDGVFANDAVPFGTGQYVLETTVSAWDSSTKTVTLTDSFDSTIAARMVAVGIAINGVTCAVASTDAANKKVVLTAAPTTTPASGQTAKVRGGISDADVNYLEMHYSRMFAAGDPSNPTRLYYSQIPGESRSIEDWSSDSASVDTSGGFIEIGDSFGDPIVGLLAISNQLLVWKRYSVYALYGSKPSEFTVIKLETEVERMAHSSVVTHSGVPYYMTPAGMFRFNGSTVTPMTDARKIQTFMQGAYIELCKGAENKDILYFTCYVGSDPTTRDYDNAIIVYDLNRRTYMIRSGFQVADLISHDGTLYMINDAGYVYRFNEGTTYDGANIDAYWCVPETDMFNKKQNKKVSEIYLRASGNATFKFTVYHGYTPFTELVAIPENTQAIVEIKPTSDRDRVFSFKIENQAGGIFSILGGLEYYIEESDRAR